MKTLIALLAAFAATWIAGSKPAHSAPQAPLSSAEVTASLQEIPDLSLPQDEEALRRQIAQLQQTLNKLQGPPKAEGLDQEQSVRPGINDSWKSDNIRPLIQRLEAESREIFTQCDTLAAVAGPQRGMCVADVGAGSGFMAQIFAKIVGEEGKVYAVDINAGLMERLALAAKVEGVANLETVVCTEKSVELPPESVDMVFLCDTYHHFEYPRNSLRSIFQALRPGGQFVVVDFHRIEGVSRKFVLDHVRAGEEVFTQEILDSGFKLINTHYLPQLKENYMLRFRKPS